MNKPPNVLIFIPHDLGDFLHCYDHGDVKSPNLDRLAGNGVRFTNYFTTSPECTSSRSTMLTGLHTHQNGLVGLAGMGWELDNPECHLASRLKRAGYQTHLFGVNHETAKSPDSLGYQHLHAQDNKKLDNVCRQLIDFLKDAPSGQPWFAHAGFFHVHRIWPEETTFSPDEVVVPECLPDTPEIRQDYTRFYQNILDMDTEIGRVLDELEKQQLLDNTLVIFTTDHGSPFPRAKATYYDAGIRIPLIMSHAGQIPAGNVDDSLLSNLDFTPTILDYCGVDPDLAMTGRSFADLLTESGDYTEQDAIYGGMCFDVSYDPIYYVRTREFKYVRSFAVDDQDAQGADPQTRAVFAAGKWIRFDDYDVMSSPAWQSIAEKVDRSRPDPEELYDLANDPLETRNLVGNPDYSQTLEHLRELLEGMMAQTNCPLLTDHVPPTPEQIDAAISYGRKLGIRD